MVLDISPVRRNRPQKRFSVKKKTAEKDDTEFKDEENAGESTWKSIDEKSTILHSGDFRFFLVHSILYLQSRKQITLNSRESEGVSPLAPRRSGCARVFALLNFRIFCYGGGESVIFLFLIGFLDNESSRGV